MEGQLAYDPDNLTFYDNTVNISQVRLTAAVIPLLVTEHQQLHLKLFLRDKHSFLELKQKAWL